MPIITPKIPEGLPELMRGLAKSIIKQNPQNIYEHAAEYFENLLRERDGDLDKVKKYTAYRVLSDLKNRKSAKKCEPSCNCGKNNTTAVQTVDVENVPIVQTKKKKKSGKKVQRVISAEEKSRIIPENESDEEMKLKENTHQFIFESAGGGQELKDAPVAKEKSMDKFNVVKPTIKSRDTSAKSDSDNLIAIEEVISEEMRGQAIHRAVVKIQACYRGFMVRKINLQAAKNANAQAGNTEAASEKSEYTSKMSKINNKSTTAAAAALVASVAALGVAEVMKTSMSDETEKTDSKFKDGKQLLNDDNLKDEQIESIDTVDDALKHHPENQVASEVAQEEMNVQNDISFEKDNPHIDEPEDSKMSNQKSDDGVVEVTDVIIDSLKSAGTETSNVRSDSGLFDTNENDQEQDQHIELSEGIDESSNKSSIMSQLNAKADAAAEKLNTSVKEMTEAIKNAFESTADEIEETTATHENNTESITVDEQSSEVDLGNELDKCNEETGADTSLMSKANDFIEKLEEHIDLDMKKISENAIESADSAVDVAGEIEQSLKSAEKLAEEAAEDLKDDADALLPDIVSEIEEKTSELPKLFENEKEQVQNVEDSNDVADNSKKADVVSVKLTAVETELTKVIQNSLNYAENSLDESTEIMEINADSVALEVAEEVTNAGEPQNPENVENNPSLMSKLNLKAGSIAASLTAGVAGIGAAVSNSLKSAADTIEESGTGAIENLAAEMNEQIETDLIYQNQEDTENKLVEDSFMSKLNANADSAAASLDASITAVTDAIKHSLHSDEPVTENEVSNHRILESETDGKNDTPDSQTENTGLNESPQKSSFMSKLNSKADAATVSLNSSINEVIDTVKHSLHFDDDTTEKETASNDTQKEDTDVIKSPQTSSLMSKLNSKSNSVAASLSASLNEMTGSIEHSFNNDENDGTQKENVYTSESLMNKLNVNADSDATLPNLSITEIDDVIRDSLHSNNATESAVSDHELLEFKSHGNDDEPETPEVDPDVHESPQKLSFMSKLNAKADSAAASLNDSVNEMTEAIRQSMHSDDHATKNEISDHELLETDGNDDELETSKVDPDTSESPQKSSFLSKLNSKAASLNASVNKMADTIKHSLHFDDHTTEENTASNDDGTNPQKEEIHVNQCSIMSKLNAKADSAAASLNASINEVTDVIKHSFIYGDHTIETDGNDDGSKTQKEDNNANESLYHGKLESELVGNNDEPDTRNENTDVKESPKSSSFMSKLNKKSDAAASSSAAEVSGVSDSVKNSLKSAVHTAEDSVNNVKDNANELLSNVSSAVDENASKLEKELNELLETEPNSQNQNNMEKDSMSDADASPKKSSFMSKLNKKADAAAASLATSISGLGDSVQNSLNSVGHSAEDSIKNMKDNANELLSELKNEASQVLETEPESKNDNHLKQDLVSDAKESPVKSSFMNKLNAKADSAVASLAAGISGASDSVKNSIKSTSEHLEDNANEMFGNFESEVEQSATDLKQEVSELLEAELHSQNENANESPKKHSFMSKLNAKANAAAASLNSGVTEMTDAIKHSLHLDEHTTNKDNESTSKGDASETETHVEDDTGERDDAKTDSADFKLEKVTVVATTGVTSSVILEMETMENEPAIFGTDLKDNTDESNEPSFMSKLNKKADEASEVLNTSITEMTDAIKHSLHLDDKEEDKEHDGIVEVEDAVNHTINTIGSVEAESDKNENIEEKTDNDKTPKKTSMLGKLNKKAATVTSAMTVGAAAAAYALKDSMNSFGKDEENIKKNVANHIEIKKREHKKNERDSTVSEQNYGPFLEHETVNTLFDTEAEEPTIDDIIENESNCESTKKLGDNEKKEDEDAMLTVFEEDVKNAAAMVVGEVVHTAEAIKNSLELPKSDDNKNHDQVTSQNKEINTENDEIPGEPEKYKNTADKDIEIDYNKNLEQEDIKKSTEPETIKTSGMKTVSAETLTQREKFEAKIAAAGLKNTQKSELDPPHSIKKRSVLDSTSSDNEQTDSESNNQHTLSNQTTLDIAGNDDEDPLLSVEHEHAENVYQDDFEQGEKLPSNDVNDDNVIGHIAETEKQVNDIVSSNIEVEVKNAINNATMANDGLIITKESELDFKENTLLINEDDKHSPDVVDKSARSAKRSFMKTRAVNTQDNKTIEDELDNGKDDVQHKNETTEITGEYDIDKTNTSKKSLDQNIKGDEQEESNKKGSVEKHSPVSLRANSRFNSAEKLKITQQNSDESTSNSLQEETKDNSSKYKPSFMKKLDRKAAAVIAGGAAALGAVFVRRSSSDDSEKNETKNKDDHKSVKKINEQETEKIKTEETPANEKKDDRTTSGKLEKRSRIPIKTQKTFDASDEKILKTQIEPNEEVKSNENNDQNYEQIDKMVLNNSLNSEPIQPSAPPLSDIDEKIVSITDNEIENSDSQHESTEKVKRSLNKKDQDEQTEESPINNDTDKDDPEEPKATIESHDQDKVPDVEETATSSQDSIIQDPNEAIVIDKNSITTVEDEDPDNNKQDIQGNEVFVNMNAKLLNQFSYEFSDDFSDETKDNQNEDHTDEELIKRFAKLRKSSITDGETGEVTQSHLPEYEDYSLIWEPNDDENDPMSVEEETCITRSVSQTTIISNDNDYDVLTGSTATPATAQQHSMGDNIEEESDKPPTPETTKRIKNELAEIESYESEANKDSIEAMFYTLKKKELERDLIVSKTEPGGSGLAKQVTEDDDDVVIINATSTSDDDEEYSLISFDPMAQAALKNQQFLDHLHGRIDNAAEDEDDFDEFQPGSIRKRILASSFSKADSDCFDPADGMSQLNDNNIKTTLETITSTDSETSTIISAATKIQAGARGYLARKQVQSIRTSSSSQAQQASFGNAAIDQSLDDMIELKQKQNMDLEQEAAIRIQRTYRNFLSTRRVEFSQMRAYTEDLSNHSYDDRSNGHIIDVKLEKRSSGKRRLEEQRSVDSVDSIQYEPLDEPDSELKRRSKLFQSLNVDVYNSASRRMTFHRGDAVYKNSTPENDSGKSNTESTEKVQKTLEVTTNQSIPSKHPQEVVNTKQVSVAPTVASTPTASTATATRKKKNRLTFGIRQRSMPVQIETTIIRVLPKHLRKRIKSAEADAEKKKKYITSSFEHFF